MPASPWGGHIGEIWSVRGWVFFVGTGSRMVICNFVQVVCVHEKQKNQGREWSHESFLNGDRFAVGHLRLSSPSTNHICLHISSAEGCLRPGVVCCRNSNLCLVLTADLRVLQKLTTSKSLDQIFYNTEFTPIRVFLSTRKLPYQSTIAA